MDTHLLTERLNQWSRETELPLHPERLSASTYEDALGQPGVSVLLELSPPAGETWDIDQLTATRREVRRHVDQLLLEGGEPTLGNTIVQMTSSSGPEGSMATDEVIGNDEGTSR